MQQHTTRKSPAGAAKHAAYVESVGRRKTAIARVRITPRQGGGEGAQIVVNDAPFQKYFSIAEHYRTVVAPLEKTDMVATTAVSAKVRGGGLAAQAEAVRLGIARALVKKNDDLKKSLRAFGFLTRDARMVERKKYGLKKARRAPQWSKR